VGTRDNRKGNKVRFKLPKWEILPGCIIFFGSLLTGFFVTGVLKQIPAMLFGVAAILMGVNVMEKERRPTLSKIAGITGITLVTLALIASFIL